MKVLEQTVHFDDEGHFQDVLAGNGVGSQSTQDSLRRLIDDGAVVTVRVPDMPPRALVLKSTLERVTGLTIDGPDLLAIPLGT